MAILFLYHELSSWAVLFPQQDMIFTKKKKKKKSSKKMLNSKPNGLFEGKNHEVWTYLLKAQTIMGKARLIMEIRVIK